MTILLNGQEQTVPSTSTIQDVVALCCGTPIPQGVAVALNQMVVPRQQWTSVTVADGDEVEVLWASSGG
jgi:sulfur carrier protein